MAQVAVVMIVAAIAAYAQYKQSEHEADMMEAQADYQDWEASLAESQSIRDADRHRKNVRRLIGRQTAKLAASGVDISSGSPLTLMAETAYEGEMDAQDILYQGKISKTAKEYGAKLSRFRASGTRIAGRWAAMGTLASGTAKATTMSSGGASGGGSFGGTNTYQHPTGQSVYISR